jgi:hypothetical protein
MPSNLLDIFNDDAFTLVSLTDAINKIDHVPGQAGALTFAGNASGIATTKVAIEQKSTALSIIPFSQRGGPAPQGTRDKASLVSVEIPHVVKQQTIQASAVQDNRGFGTTELASAQTVINDAQFKLGAELDLTLEHMRLGALHGEIRDADGSVILNLFDTLNVSEPAAVEFSSSAGTLRDKCMFVKRQIEAAAKMILPPGAKVISLCSPDFFDEFTGHADVTVAFANWQASAANLADDVRSGFDFGGITWIEYRGTDTLVGESPSESDLVGEVGIVAGDCRLFLTGVPSLYVEKYAPADYFDSINGVGLPKYSRLAVDPEFGRYARLEVQSNPLPLVTRPATLVRGHF